MAAVTLNGLALQFVPARPLDASQQAMDPSEAAAAGGVAGGGGGEEGAGPRECETRSGARGDGSEWLREDLDIALEACMQNGLALRFVAPELRAHHDLVLVAV